MLNISTILFLQKGACRYNETNIGATISSCVDVTSGDEMQLQKAVAEVGPISVAIDASHLSFQLYNSGRDLCFFNALRVPCLLNQKKHKFSRKCLNA